MKHYFFLKNRFNVLDNELKICPSNKIKKDLRRKQGVITYIININFVGSKKSLRKS